MVERRVGAEDEGPAADGGRHLLEERSQPLARRFDSEAAAAHPPSCLVRVGKRLQWMQDADLGAAI